MKLRFRFSLRTLLLASFCAGGAMLVWSVREPWRLCVLPLSKRAMEAGDVWFGIPDELDVSISPDGKYLFSRPNDYYLRDLQDAETSVVVDLDRKMAVITSPRLHGFDWHPERNWCLYRDRDTNMSASVRECPSQKTLFNLVSTEGERSYSFVANGKFLLDCPAIQSVGTENKIRVYDTRSWQLAFEKDCNATHALIAFSPSGTNYAVASDAINHNIDESFFAIAHHLEAFDIKLHKLLWKWEMPKNCNSIEAVTFNHDGAAIEVRCDAKSGLGFGEFKFMLESSSGAKLSEEYGSGIGWSNSIPRWQVLSADEKWRIIARWQLEILDETSGKTLCVLRTGNELFWGPLLISANKQRIAARFGQNQAIWTRTREHLEWWGLYERWETWLALALFAAFVWSIVCDFMPLRMAPGERKSSAG